MFYSNASLAPGCRSIIISLFDVTVGRDKKTYQNYSTRKMYKIENTILIAYTMRMVFVKPDPCFHPVTTTTGSPDLMKPRALPKRTPNCTRSSTSFIQSLCAGTEFFFFENYEL